MDISDSALSVMKGGNLIGTYSTRGCDRHDAVYNCFDDAPGGEKSERMTEDRERVVMFDGVHERWK